MAHKEQLSRLHGDLVLNKKSKRQDSNIRMAIEKVIGRLKADYPRMCFRHTKTQRLNDIISALKKQFPQVPFDTCLDQSFVSPDGGILTIVGREGDEHIILIGEKKNQGTNDRRACEGKKKQAKGNAIERLGKNVIGFRAEMLSEGIFPFVCFGDGCDFTPGSSIIDRVKTIAMFGRLNEYNVVNAGPQSQFNRGSYFFRQKEWTIGEMADISLEVAKRSICYYQSRYGTEYFQRG